jgi:Alg9-like mannosyltransferase family
MSKFLPLSISVWSILGTAVKPLSKSEVSPAVPCMNAGGRDMTPVVWTTPARIAICLRIAVALLSVTYFQPDEYFQSLEPAHHLVFGYGHLTWEWRIRPPIRSIFFPMLFTPVYWLLKVLGLDETYLLVWVLFILFAMRPGRVEYFSLEFIDLGSKSCSRIVCLCN